MSEIIPVEKRRAHGSPTATNWPNDVIAASWVTAAQREMDFAIADVRRTEVLLTTAERRVEAARRDLVEARKALAEVILTQPVRP